MECRFIYGNGAFSRLFMGLRVSYGLHRGRCFTTGSARATAPSCALLGVCTNASIGLRNGHLLSLCLSNRGVAGHACRGRLDHLGCLTRGAIANEENICGVKHGFYVGMIIPVRLWFPLLRWTVPRRRSRFKVGGYQ